MSLSDVLSGGALEVDARAADELRDDDTLGAVDDEGAALGHEREVAHEDRLALDLAGVGVHELGGHEERRVVGLVALLARLDRLAGLLEAVVAERQRHRAAEVLDRGDLLEDLLEAGPVRARRCVPRPWPRRREPASARCRAASRSSPSEAPGGRGPRVVRESWRRTDAPKGVCAVDMFVAVREAAKEGPSTGLFRIFRSALPHGSARGSRGHAECREAMGSGLTEVAKDGHGQRKGLAYPQRAGVSSRVKERRSSHEGPPGLETTGCPRRDLPRPLDRELAMRTRRIWPSAGLASRPTPCAGASRAPRGRGSEPADLQEHARWTRCSEGSRHGAALA